MEVRINNHGANSLSTKILFSDEKGFEVASGTGNRQKGCRSDRRPVDPLQRLPRGGGNTGNG